MPLDSHLNKDAHDSVRRNIGATFKLDDDDPRKLSMATLKKGEDAHLRTWELVPDSKRILHDIDEVFESMHWIVKMQGLLILKRGDRPGRRFQPKGGQVVVRVKGSGRKAELFLHLDVEASQTEFFEEAVAKLEEMEVVEEEERQKKKRWRKKNERSVIKASVQCK